MRQKRKLSGLMLGLYLMQPAIVSAGAVSIPVEARETAEAALFAAQSQLYAEEAAKYRREADAYRQEAATTSSEADQQIVLLEKDLVEKRSFAEKLQAAAAEQAARLSAASAGANDLTLQAEAAWENAAEAAQAAENQENSLAQQLAEADEAAAAAEAASTVVAIVNSQAPASNPIDNLAEETDELLILENEIKRQEAAMLAERTSSLPAAMQSGEAAQNNFVYPDFSAAQAEVARAYALAAELQSAAEDIQARAEQAYVAAEAQQQAADAALVAAGTARQAVLDNEYILADARLTAADARKEAAGAQAYYEQLVYEQDNPPAYRYGETGFEYYRWKSGAKQGYQLVQPVRVGYSDKNSYYGLSVNHIIANNMSPVGGGKINTFSDTLLYLSKKQEKSEYVLNYSLGLNIPTGRAALSAAQRNARMNDDLVAYSQFGEGWNISPAIAVTSKIGKEDSWTFSTGYNWRGAYDPTRDVANDDLNPGNEWRNSLKWQHAGQKWQFVGELLYTITGASTVANGENYDTGNTWETRLTYNRQLDKQQNIMMYYWYNHENATIDVAQAVKVSPVHYFGAMWSKKLQPTQTLRVTIDGMAAAGQRYDSLNNRYVNGRHKYTVGVGYDFHLKAEQTISFDVQKFILHDGAAEHQVAEKYHGFNVFLKYGGSF